MLAIVRTLPTTRFGLGRQLRPQLVTIEKVPGVRKVDGRSFHTVIVDELTGAGSCS